MGKVVACGSHVGTSSAEYADHCNVKGVIFNDAGIGKDNAGMEGIKRLEAKGIAAATVSCQSARINEASDTFQSGVISAVNQMAENSGVRVGMTTKEALNLMLRI